MRPVLTSTVVEMLIAIVWRGWSAQVRILKDGAEVARLPKGVHFGEQALLKNQRRNADVVAATEVVVLEMSQEDFQGIANKVRAHVLL